MYVKHNLIEDAGGNFVFSVVQDNTEHAKATQQEKAETGGWTEERTMKKMVSVPPYVYQEYSNLYGAECWQSKDFLKWFKAHRPEYCL